MKCPKCGYLGFEELERCRNCGYDFSLTPSRNTPELSIRAADQADSAFEDLELVDGASLSPRRPSPPPSGSAADGPGGGGRASSELPLFGEPSADDDAPLVSYPSPPRQPLSVRRATPEVPKLRSSARASMLDLAEESVKTPGLPPAERAHAAHWSADRSSRSELEAAALAARGAAVALDLLILAAIDTVVVYLTIQICGLTIADLAVLPKPPLIAFLLLQNGGYLVAFTVGGQTLGKMAVGIKVVPARPEAPVDLGRSIVRTLVWVILAAPAGLGFLTALVGPERRGLHDRAAGTRVVRALA